MYPPNRHPCLEQILCPDPMSLSSIWLLAFPPLFPFHFVPCARPLVRALARVYEIFESGVRLMKETARSRGSIVPSGYSFLHGSNQRTADASGSPSVCLFVSSFAMATSIHPR